MNSRPTEILAEFSIEQQLVVNDASESKIESGRDQLFFQQKLSLGTLPGESCKHIPSFLSVEDLSKIKPTRTRINDSADWDIHFDRCLNHPQHLHKDSLAYYLIERLAQQTLLEEKQAPEEKIQAYFNREFDQYSPNLLTNYEAIKNKLVDQTWYTFSTRVEYIKQHFYPHVSSQWIKNECRSVWKLAQEIQSDYRAVFNEDGETKLTEPPVKPLLVNLSSKKIKKIYNFFERTYFLEKLWSDLSFLHSLLPSLQHALQNNVWHTFEGQVEGGAADQAIINFFKQPRLTRNISYLSILVIKFFKPQYFCNTLLIDNPSLFHHLNQLPIKELIWIAKDSFRCINFFRKLIEKDEIYSRLESHHYRDIASLGQEDCIPCFGAVNIGLFPQIIAKLTDNDLLFMLSGTKMYNDFLKLYTENADVKKRMNTQLWFDLVIQKVVWLGWDAFVIKNKAIYDLFSPEQLKQLIIKKCDYYTLLLDNDVFKKIYNIFTIDEVNNLLAWPWDSIKKLNTYDTSKMLNDEKIYFWVENNIVKVSWFKYSIGLTRILSAEDSKKLVDMWGDRTVLKKTGNNQLFNNIIFSLLYLSGVEKRIKQLYRQTIVKDITKLSAIRDSLPVFPEEKMAFPMPAALGFNPIEEKRVSTTSASLLPSLHKEKSPLKQVSLESLPIDLFQYILSFLSAEDLARIKRVNNQVRYFADLAIYFDRCWSHPQHLQMNSLSHSLMYSLPKNSSGEHKVVPEEIIQSHFNLIFGECSANLLTEYNVLYNQLFVEPSLYGENLNFLIKSFYPQIQSSEWIKIESRALWELAPKIRSDFWVFFNRETGVEESKIDLTRPLPASLPLKQYKQLSKFLDRVHFLEQLWSDYTFLKSLLPCFYETIQNNRMINYLIRRNVGAANLAIINFFEKPHLSRNVSYLGFLFIKNLLPQFFNGDLLIDNARLYNHFSQIPVKNLIKFIQSIPHDIGFFKKLIEKPEIHARLKSHDYRDLAYSSDLITIISSKAEVILSLPQAIAKLTDDDLLILLSNKKCNNDFLTSWSGNPVVKEKMNGDLWFRFIQKSFSLEEISFVAKNKEIYSLFSPEQLKKLILREYYCSALLLDDEVFSKIYNIFTINEVNILRNRLFDSIERLQEYSHREIFTQNKIFFFVENNVVKLSWVEFETQTIRILNSVDSKKIIDMWGQRDTLQKGQDAVLFNQLISIFGYSSRVQHKIDFLHRCALSNRILKHSAIRDSLPEFIEEKSVFTEQLTILRKFPPDQALPSAGVYVYPTALFADLSPKLALAEEKSVSKTNAPIHLVRHLQAAILLGSTLMISGAAVGIAALFLPYLLTAAIVVLGAALLAFSAYGILRYSQRGFFSPRQSLTTNQVNQPLIPIDIQIFAAAYQSC